MSWNARDEHFGSFSRAGGRHTTRGASRSTYGRVVWLRLNRPSINLSFSVRWHSKKWLNSLQQANRHIASLPWGFRLIHSILSKKHSAALSKTSVSTRYKKVTAQQLIFCVDHWLTLTCTTSGSNKVEGPPAVPGSFPHTLIQYDQLWAFDNPALSRITNVKAKIVIFVAHRNTNWLKEICLYLCRSTNRSSNTQEGDLRHAVPLVCLTNLREQTSRLQPMLDKIRHCSTQTRSCM